MGAVGVHRRDLALHQASRPVEIRGTYRRRGTALHAAGVPLSIGLPVAMSAVTVAKTARRRRRR